jgi:hypothetical protein
MDGAKALAKFEAFLDPAMIRCRSLNAGSTSIAVAETGGRGKLVPVRPRSFTPEHASSGRARF